MYTRRLMTHDEDETTQPVEPSPVARELARLKKVTFQAAAERERLPQPLFWSVFGQQLKEIKKLKAEARAVEAILYGSEVEK